MKQGNVLSIGAGKKIGKELSKNNFNYTTLDMNGEADVKMNLLKDDMPFKDNSFDIVEAYHVIEHLHLKGIDITFNEIKRVLKPNGILKIKVPDFEHLCELFLKTINVNYKRRLMEYFFGHQNSRSDPMYENIKQAVHHYGFDTSLLMKTLNNFDFEVIEINTNNILPHAQCREIYCKSKNIKE